MFVRVFLWGMHFDIVCCFVVTVLVVYTRFDKAILH